MSITTTTTKITRKYLDGRTRDQLIELIELLLNQSDFDEAVIRELAEFYDPGASPLLPLYSQWLKDREEK